MNRAAVTAAAAASAGCAAPTATNAKGAFCTPLPVSAQAISGNLGRNAVRSFALRELDFSLHREFLFTERFRLRFQADMFNVFNQPNFGPFANTVNGATFGTTTNMANAALGAGIASGSGQPDLQHRQSAESQFALKLYLSVMSRVGHGRLFA
jgi:hypothetical protein